MKTLFIFLSMILAGVPAFAQSQTVLKAPFEGKWVTTVDGNGACWKLPDGVGFHTIRWIERGTLSAGTIKLQGSNDSTCTTVTDIITAQAVTSSGHVIATAGQYLYAQLVAASLAGGGTLEVHYFGDKSASAGGSAVTVTSGSITGDTELAAAAAIADDMANPTVPGVAAHLMAWNSTGNGWDRVPVSSDNCDGTSRSKTRIKSDNTNNDDETQVKATSGTLCGITGWNSNATTATFAKCTNLTAANTTPGTSAIFYSVMLPAASNGGAIHLNIPFDTALTCYLATGAADSDATDPAQNEVEVYVIYN